MGLVNPKEITYGRVILQDPNQGIKSMVYRDLAIQIFDKMIDWMLNDPIIYNRTRQLLSQKHKMSKESFDNLAAKAEKANINLLTIIEVYNEGLKQDYPLHLSPEQRAYNRVNAFIAHEDNEFAGINDSTPSDREQGTTSLTNIYKRGTPGQSKTLKTLKKVIKK